MTTLSQALHHTAHNLDRSTREKLVLRLNQTTATLLDYYSQAKYAHWNVKGPQFMQLHELFDALAAYTIGAVDLVAERVTALGGVASGTVRQAQEQSILSEYTLGAVSGTEHLMALVSQTADLATYLRESIDLSAEWGDAGTSDMYTELSREYDKQLWFLEAHTQG